MRSEKGILNSIFLKEFRAKKNKELDIKVKKIILFIKAPCLFKQKVILYLIELL